MDDLGAGRTLTKWAEVPPEASDILVASERLDSQTIQHPRFNHSTFANVSFLKAEVEDGAFMDCTFIQCYFRDADLKRTSFVGCKFIDCNFRGAKLSSVNMSYSHFRRSVVPYSEMQYSAPSEPNLKRDLFQELSRSAAEVGAEGEARRYRLAAIEAQNIHLRAAVTHQSVWYQEHFPWDRRVAAGLKLVWHFLNKVLWRHGESAPRLLGCALISALMVFPGLMWPSRPSGANYGDLVWLSLSNMLSVDRLSNIVPSSTYLRGLSAAEGLVGIAFAGLIVTLILKALLRR